MINKNYQIMAGKIYLLGGLLLGIFVVKIIIFDIIYKIMPIDYKFMIETYTLFVIACYISLFIILFFEKWFLSGCKEVWFTEWLN